MPIIKSAKKRSRQAPVRHSANLVTKENLRKAIKALEKEIAGGNAQKVTEALRVAQSALDVAVKKNVIHKNKAARKMSRLNAKAKAVAFGKVVAEKKVAKAKPATPAKAKTVKKAAPKKAAPKKATKTVKKAKA